MNPVSFSIRKQMREIVAATEEILIANNVPKDIRKYVIIPMVRINELHRRKEVSKFERTYLTLFVPKASDKVTILHYRPRVDDNKSAFQYHLLTLDLKTNEIVCGQWLLNKKINIKLSDLSPDGKYLVYHLRDYDLHDCYQYLTVISKVPHLTGLQVSQYRTNYRDEMFGGKRDHGGFFVPHEEGYSLKYIRDQNTIIKSTGPLPFEIYESNAFNRQLREAELAICEVSKLKDMLKVHGLPQTGIKFQLLGRLLDQEEKRHNAVHQKREVCERHDLKDGSVVNVKGKTIGIQNGWLTVNGVKLHDFTLDVFEDIPPPEDYGW